MPGETGVVARSAGQFPQAGLALLCLGVLMTVGFGGCKSDLPPGNAPNATPNPIAATPGGTTAANPSSATVSRSHEPFDGDRAYAILQKQCGFGVRPLGTAAHERTKAYLIAEMQKYADATVTQKFTYRGMPVTNVIGVFYPAGSDKPSEHPILLMAHWDTRPIADGPYSDKRKLGYKYGAQGWKPTAPIMGANDGASGAAALLEIARILKKQKPATGVLLLLDDGEDYGDFRMVNNRGEGVELGSRYFAEHFKETPAFGHPFYGILLDMVGGKEAVFPREEFSEINAKSVNDKVFTDADQLGYAKVFLSDKSQPVNDDHIAINMAGIPMIDIIHPLPQGPKHADEELAYRYWHTQQDTADKCNPKTLKIVGDVVLKVLYSETP